MVLVWVGYAIATNYNERETSFLLNIDLNVRVDEGCVNCKITNFFFSSCAVENHSDVYDSSGVGDTPENVGLDSILAPRSNTTNAAKSKIPVQINYRKISAEENSRSRVKLPRNKSFDSTAKFLKKNDEMSRRFRSFSSLLRQNFDSSKTRKVSTPEIQRRPFDRRCSLESHELKSDRLQIILAKHASSYLHLEDSTEAMSVADSGSSLIEINENAISTPTSRSRKLSNIFRKKSTHSKSSKENEHLRGRKYGCSNRMSLGANDLDGVIRERDRALEEWGKSATKCEELIEELEFTLSQLIIVSITLYFVLLGRWVFFTPIPPAALM